MRVDYNHLILGFDENDSERSSQRRNRKGAGGRGVGVSPPLESGVASPPPVVKWIWTAGGDARLTQGAATPLLLVGADLLRSVAFPEGENVLWQVPWIPADITDAACEVLGIADEGVAVVVLPDGALAELVGEGALPCLDEFLHGHDGLEE